MEISIRDFADNYNTIKNRRGFKMSEGYLYRLIREDNKGICKRSLWFEYIFKGDKDLIKIIVPDTVHH